MCERKRAPSDTAPLPVRVMNSRLLISLLCAGALALACGSLTKHEGTATTSTRHSSKTTTAPRVNSTFAVNIEPHALHFALNLTNESRKNVELEFPSGQQYDFSVLDSLGHEVYRWGAGRMFTQSVQNRNLDGGDTMRIEERAHTSLPRGRYVAVATLHSKNFPMKESSAFELR